jgi:hypothetical protein
MSGLGTLCKLPLELRIQIYDYVLLEKNEKILVVPTIHRKLSEEAKRQRILRLNRLAAKGRAFKPVAVKNSLLYVSKQISEEACAVLYDGHKFKLRTAQALDWFLVLIGENRQHIRHVRVMNELRLRDLPAMGRLTNKLMDAENLRSLTVRPITTMYLDNDDETIGFSGDNDISQSDVGAVVTKLALVSERLLNALYRAEKSEDKLSGVVDIFRFDLGAFDSAQDKLSAFWRSAVELRIGEPET